MSQNHLPFERRRMLHGDDPQGFRLRDWPTNQTVMRAADRHEAATDHSVTDLMDDTPGGDVCCGVCCSGCDWQREFPYSGLRPKKVRGGNPMPQPKELKPPKTNEMVITNLEFSKGNSFIRIGFSGNVLPGIANNEFIGGLLLANNQQWRQVKRDLEAKEAEQNAAHEGLVEALEKIRKFSHGGAVSMSIDAGEFHQIELMAEAALAQAKGGE